MSVVNRLIKHLKLNKASKDAGGEERYFVPSITNTLYLANLCGKTCANRFRGSLV